MCRRTYILKSPGPVPEIQIIAIGETEPDIDDDNIVSLFDDTTSNFEDLGYFVHVEDVYVETDKLKQMVHTARTRLESEGIIPKVLTQVEIDDIRLPSWWWGVERKREGSCITVPRSIEERKSILMFHLVQLEEELALWPNHYVLVK